MDSNVTLKLDDALLKRARKAAIDDSTSLSGWVAGVVVETLQKRERRRIARRRAMANLNTDHGLAPGRLPREELHGR